MTRRGRNRAEEDNGRKTHADNKLTGDPKREVTAACACTSLYKRIGMGDHFEQIWNGRTDYLPLGLERDWSVGLPLISTHADEQFDAVELENGEVVDVSLAPATAGIAAMKKLTARTRETWRSTRPRTSCPLASDRAWRSLRRRRGSCPDCRN